MGGGNLTVVKHGQRYLSKLYPGLLKYAQNISKSQALVKVVVQELIVVKNHSMYMW